MVAVLTLATAVVLFLNRADLPRGWYALRHAEIGWLLVLAAVTGLGLVVLGAEHTAAQRAVGLRPRLSRVAPLALAARFVNSVAKSGGLAGLAVFRARARRDDQPMGQVVAAYLLVTVLDVVAFAVILAAALALVVATRRFTTTDGAASVVFAGYLAVVVAVMACAARSRTAIRRLYALPRKLRTRFGPRRHPPPAEMDAGHAPADELFDAIAVVRQNPSTAFPVALTALGVDAVGTVQLWAVLHALGVDAGVAVAVVSYGLSTLLGIVGFLPGGLGFVEFSLGAVLVSFGVSVGVAATAVVLYRIAEFWMPLAVGGLTLRRVGLTTEPR